ncbi:MAG: hypothetical protein IKG58_00455 [Bacilli bacterium]|nr:hypothetical protein [Bacilli bacterium]MBR3049017.1 hypothetical protein [Bacilli bacterium]
MTNNEREIIKACEEEPSLIFNLIKGNKLGLVQYLLDRNPKMINTCDIAGNDVMMKLLQVKEYDLVLKYIKKRSWYVNHQNFDGNTIGHKLAKDNSIGALKIVDKLTKRSNYMADIKNNNGETALDRAINNNYTSIAFKFLENKKCTNIDMSSFMNLYNTYIKNNYYGKYSKLTNLEIIVKNLNKKELCPNLRDLINKIMDNIDSIKNDIIKGSGVFLDSIVNSLV